MLGLQNDLDETNSSVLSAIGSRGTHTGEFGVTHLGNTNWIHESPSVRLVVLEFHI